MKKIILLLILNFSFLTIGQEKFKYAIVPVKFSILKKENQHNVNTISKKMMESYGLETYFENQLPNNFNTCEAILIDLEENNSMFATKLTIVFKDCKNQVIFKSEEGMSREKDFKTAYNEALRNASKSIEKYDFINKNNSKNGFVVVKENIEPKSDNVEEVKLVPFKKTETINEYKTSSTTNTIGNKKSNSETKETMKLQKTSNGYFLINQNNENELQLFKTSNPSVFIAKGIDYQGVANISFKTCTVEFYQNDQLIQKTYTIE
jgi:hypothetical protein